MKKIRIYLLPILIGLIILMAAIWIARLQLITVYYRQKFFDASPESQIKKMSTLILEDREAINQYDVFKPSHGEKDAGVFLNASVHWEIGDIHHRGQLALPEFLKKEMGKDWELKKPLFKKIGLDFGWMKKLQSYDHWSPDLESPVYPEGKKFLTYSYPIPSYSDLQAWAKLRLLHGRETNDMENAFKEVRHLTRLIWTNDYLVSSIVTVSMLKLEHEIHDTLLPEQEGSWKLIPEDVLMRAKRYFYSAPAFTDVRLSDASFNLMTDTESGICLIISEGLLNYISTRDMLQNELAEAYERMGKLYNKTQGKCRKSIARRMWEDKSWPSFMYEDQDAFAYIGDQEILGKRLTWKELKEDDDLKVIMGYVLSSSANGKVLNSYER